MTASAPDEPRIHYLTVSPDLAGLGRCVTVGAALTPPGSSYPPEKLRHPHRYRMVSAGGRVLAEHQLVYIDAGTGTFEDGAGTHAVTPGSILLLRPGVWHRYAPEPASGWHEYWVGFAGAPLAQSVVVLGLHRRGPVLPAGRRPELVAQFERLLELAQLHDTAGHVEMVATVLHLLSMAARATDQPPGRADRRDAVHRALAAMQDRLTERVSVANLARECGLPVSTFRRAFSEVTGSPPYRYFMTLKINAAKLDLAHSTRSVREIAERLCFTDQFHFCRVFRDYTGVSPSRWRRG